MAACAASAPPSSSPGVSHPTLTGRPSADIVALLAEGDAALHQKEFARAFEVYTQATRDDPTSADAFVGLAKSCRWLDRWQDAAAALDTAARLAPDRAQVWFELGRTRARIAERDGAKASWHSARVALRRCLQLEPEHPRCRAESGTALAALGDDDGAMLEYTRALAILPSQSWVYAPLANLNIRHGNVAEGRRVAEAGVRATEAGSHDRLNVLLVLAWACQQQKDTASMVHALEEARDIDADGHPVILFNLGSAYLFLDPPRKRDAVDALRYFDAHVCRGNSVAKFREQCDQTTKLIELFGPGAQQ